MWNWFKGSTFVWWILYLAANWRRPIWAIKATKSN